MIRRAAPAFPGRRARLGFAAVLVATFMGGVDTYIVNLALPTIAGSLGVAVAAVQWVPLAYLLAITGTVVAFGRAADLWGPRPVLVGGLLLFSGASAAAGLSPTIVWLAFSRTAQGLGAAMMLATGQALAVDLHPEERRGRAMGWLHVAVSAGFVAGPTIGGLLIDGIGWRSVFFVTVPLGLATAWVAAVALPGGDRRSVEELDWTGALLLSGGLTALLLAVGRAVPWTGGIRTIMALAGIGLLATFLWQEAHTPRPILDLRLFRIRSFIAGLSAAVLTFVAMASNMFLVPFLLQDLLGLSATRAGLVMIAVPLTILVAAPVAGVLADRLPPRLPATGGLVLVTAAILLMSRLGAASPALAAVGVLMLYGAGAGLFQAPNNAAVLSSAPRERHGVASGTLVTMRQLGQVLGVAVAAGLWSARLALYQARMAEEAALRLSLRDAFWGLAAFGVAATVASWLRDPPEARR